MLKIVLATLLFAALVLGAIWIIWTVAIKIGEARGKKNSVQDYPLPKIDTKQYPYK